MSTPRVRKLNLISLAVLELLDEEEMHPYEMQQRLRDRGRDRLIKLTAGTLYHAVDRLEKLGLVEAVETSRQGRLPERTVYTITEEGRDAFAERLREMVSTPEDEFSEFPLALAFLHTLDREEAVARLTWRAALLEAAVAAEDVMAARLRDSGVEPLYYLDLTWQITSKRAQLDWIRTLVGQLESGAMNWPTAARVPPPASPDPASPRSGENGGAAATEGKVG
ncbi:PadR family transcriptional regulator [Streptomyces sp. NRRL F-5053]|uniref:PadR family transcriptional regulator n=1 Tax=Streptomyces sp. NRRL F-5053 TaxID=1463854 RepID=UPI00068CA3A0|nr:PadR family transcriptional regulator [Streptomyces sp. NRRL F-5053]